MEGREGKGRGVPPLDLNPGDATVANLDYPVLVRDAEHSTSFTALGAITIR